MPWKEITVMKEKRKFLEEYFLNEYTFSVLCKRYNISRKTGYQIVRRYKQEGLRCLVPLSKKPHTSPNKTALQIEHLILETRDKYSRWSGVKIKEYLTGKGHIDLPSPKTINSILKRHGRITEAESEKHKPWIRFEHELPNDLWQIDFKGHFALNNERRCYPLTLLDDHSRYCLLVKACSNQTRDTVENALIGVFRAVGLPKAMTMDNGAPWGYSGEQLHTKFSAWLIRLGIIVKHSRPNHPQTQGKLERFHRTLKEELLSAYSFDDLAHVQQGFDWWLTIYNTQRPHEAIGLKTPSTRYESSQTIYPEKLPSIEYPEYMEVRKVQMGGLINYKGKEYRVGDAFRGDPVGIVPDENDMAIIYYCHQKILKLDLKNHCK